MLIRFSFNKNTFMTKTCLFAVLLLTLTFFSCDKKESSATFTLDDFQGEWTEIEVGFAYAGSTHHFSVNEENATLNIMVFTDVILPNATCPGNRTDYVTGTVAITADKFIFTGSYSDEGFEEIISNCEDESTYTLDFSYIFEDNVLTLNPTADEYYQIRLEQK